MRRTGPAPIAACMLAAALLWAPPSAAEKPAEGFRAPKDPSVPPVELLDRKYTGREKAMAATIVTARGDKKTGTLDVTFGAIDVELVEEGARRKTSVALADIESIEFTRWRGIERRKNEFAFYPCEIRIVLRDRKQLLCAGRIPVLNRLSFRQGGESRFIYSFFYDYLKGGSWKNSGQAGREYPETNPFGDTLVRIIFIREEMKNPLEKLLSR